MPDPFYSTAKWQTVRNRAVARWRRRGKACAWCGGTLHYGRERLAVDHVIRRRDAPSLALNIDNLVVMHHTCHSKKTRHVEQNPRPQLDEKGYPPGWRDAGGDC